MHRASAFNHSSHRRLVATKLLSRATGAQPGRAASGEADSLDRAAQPLQNGSASASEIAAGGQQHSGAPSFDGPLLHLLAGSPALLCPSSAAACDRVS